MLGGPVSCDGAVDWQRRCRSAAVTRFSAPTRSSAGGVRRAAQRPTCNDVDDDVDDLCREAWFQRRTILARAVEAAVRSQPGKGPFDRPPAPNHREPMLASGLRTMCSLVRSRVCAQSRQPAAKPPSANTNRTRVRRYQYER